MGYLKASFDGDTFKNIEGYRISVCLSPIIGFQGHFYVYLWDRMEAGTAFEAPVDVGEEGKTRRGTLEIADSERSYKFEGVDLRYAEVGVSRRERYRLLEFRFDKERIDTQSSPVTLTNSSDAKLKKSALDEDYTFSLGGGSQQLLGFRSVVAANHASVVRFSALRCKENSFLQKALDLNAEQQKDNTKMPTFTVTFSQGDIEVTQNNLIRFYVDESYGELRRIGLPKLTDLTEQELNPERLRIRMDDLSGEQLLDHDSAHQFVETQLDPKTIETATLVFETGFQRQLKIK